MTKNIEWNNHFLCDDKLGNILIERYNTNNEKECLDRLTQDILFGDYDLFLQCCNGDYNGNLKNAILRMISEDGIMQWLIKKAFDVPSERNFKAIIKGNREYLALTLVDEILSSPTFVRRELRGESLVTSYPCKNGFETTWWQLSDTNEESVYLAGLVGKDTVRCISYLTYNKATGSMGGFSEKYRREINPLCRKVRSQWGYTSECENPRK